MGEYDDDEDDPTDPTGARKAIKRLMETRRMADAMISSVAQQTKQELYELGIQVEYLLEISDMNSQKQQLQKLLRYVHGQEKSCFNKLQEDGLGLGLAIPL